MNEKNDGDVLNNGVSFVGKHWGAIASFAYLYLVFMGMLMAYFEFKPYDINIFEYSNLEDFILGVFKNFWVFLLGVFIAVYFLIFIFWIEPHFPNQKSWKSYSLLTTVGVALAPLIIIGVINFSKSESNIKTELLKDDNRIIITLRQGHLKDFTDNGQAKEYYLIGSQGGYLFIIATNEGRSYESNPIIIPISNVSAIKAYQENIINKKILTKSSS